MRQREPSNADLVTPLLAPLRANAAPTLATCPQCLAAVRRTSDDGRCYSCANVCSQCEGAGLVATGIRDDAETCSSCAGYGTQRPEHWHSGPLRAGQFCVACEQGAA